jgi:hypothetical protein
MLERKIETLQKLLTASMVISVILLVAVVYLATEVRSTNSSMDSLNAQATTAVSTFMPELDERLGRFEKKLSSVEKSLGGIDSRIDAAQERFIRKLEAEMPEIIERQVR